MISKAAFKKEPKSVFEQEVAKQTQRFKNIKDDAEKQFGRLLIENQEKWGSESCLWVA